MCRIPFDASTETFGTKADTLTEASSSVCHPRVPPDKYFLPTYAWFDYVRPLNKQDIFNWRGKKEGTELKEEKKREAPKRKLKD